MVNLSVEPCIIDEDEVMTETIMTNVVTKSISDCPCDTVTEAKLLFLYIIREPYSINNRVSNLVPLSQNLRRHWPSF